eukprot:1862068-Amphidinium_carterae.1
MRGFLAPASSSEEGELTSATACLELQANTENIRLQGRLRFNLSMSVAPRTTNTSARGLQLLLPECYC